MYLELPAGLEPATRRLRRLLYRLSYRSVLSGAQGWIRTSDVSYVPELQSGAFKSTRLICAFGGSGRIRTHGGFLLDRFQGGCNKPDSATLP